VAVVYVCACGINMVVLGDAVHVCDEMWGAWQILIRGRGIRICRCKLYCMCLVML
jgi:hypothetical protein